MLCLEGIIIFFRELPQGSAVIRHGREQIFPAVTAFKGILPKSIVRYSAHLLDPLVYAFFLFRYFLLRSIRIFCFFIR